MNLILIDPGTITTGDQDTPILWSPGDKRAGHVRNILKMGPGQTFDVGQINGPLGKALITQDGPDGMELKIKWQNDPTPPHPVDLIIGLPRPQTARKILRESASLGVRSLSFFRSQKGESSYADSRLWQTEQWRTLLHQGAEQAFTTHIPELTHGESLNTCVQSLNNDCDRIALDNYEAPEPLYALSLKHQSCTVAVGSERGWSVEERDQLRAAGFTLAHLGQRVLRSETACIAALALIAAKQQGG